MVIGKGILRTKQRGKKGKSLIMGGKK